MKILILDDDDTRHDDFAQKYKNHDVNHVKTYIDCISSLKSGSYDFVFLDNDLHGLGYESIGIDDVTGKHVELEGVDVAIFMLGFFQDRLKPKVVVHSWNTEKSDMMMDMFGENGFVVFRSEWDPSRKFNVEFF